MSDLLSRTTVSMLPVQCFASSRCFRPTGTAFSQYDGRLEPVCSKHKHGMRGTPHVTVLVQAGKNGSIIMLPLPEFAAA